jgi:hypothetical protein
MHTLRPPAPSLPLLMTTMAETARLVVLLPCQCGRQSLPQARLQPTIGRCCMRIKWRRHMVLGLSRAARSRAAEDGGVASRCRRSTATLLAAQAVKDEQRAGLETEGGATGRWRSRRGTVPGFTSDCAAAPARFQFAKLRKHPRSRARGFMGERSATAPIGRLTLRVRQIRRLAG